MRPVFPLCWKEHVESPVQPKPVDEELNILNQQVSQLYQTGRYGEATPLAERYVDLAKDRHGEDHPIYGTAIVWLATLYRAQGRYAEAEPLYKRSPGVREKALGPDHPDVRHAAQQSRIPLRRPRPLRRGRAALQARHRDPREGPGSRPLGCRHLAEQSWPVLCTGEGRYARPSRSSVAPWRSTRGAWAPTIPPSPPPQQPGPLLPGHRPYAEAEPLYQARALAIPRRRWAPTTRRRHALNNLAELYGARAATPRPSRSTSAPGIGEKALGPDHPDVAAALNNLAVLYREPGPLRRGRAALQARASRSTRRRWAPTTPMSPPSLNNLAALYRAQGRYAEAEPLYKRSLAIREKALGPDHPDVASVAQQPGRAVPSPGPLRRGRAALQARARDLREGAGPRPPRCRHRAQQPGRAVPSPGPLRRGRAALQARLAIREKALGPDHPDVASRSTTWPSCTEAQGRYAEAEPLYKRSLAIREKALGPDHPDVATALNNLAALYRAQGRYAEAEPLYKRSLAIREKALGPDHPDVATALNNLAELYKPGPLRRGRAALQARLAISRRRWAPTTPCRHALNNLAGLYEPRAATPRPSRSTSAPWHHEKALGPDHPDVATALNNLAGLYFAQRDWARAADYWRQSTA